MFTVLQIECYYIKTQYSFLLFQFNILLSFQNISFVITMRLQISVSRFHHLLKHFPEIKIKIVVILILVSPGCKFHVLFNLLTTMHSIFWSVDISSFLLAFLHCLLQVFLSFLFYISYLHGVICMSYIFKLVAAIVKSRWNF